MIEPQIEPGGDAVRRSCGEVSSVGVAQMRKDRGDLRWYVVVRYHRRPGEERAVREVIDPPGQEREKPNRRAAEALAREIRREVTLRQAERLPVVELVGRYLEDARHRDRAPLTPGTYALNAGYLEHQIASYFTDLDPAELEDGQLRRFAEAMRSVYAPDTVANLLKLLRAAFRWAEREGLLRPDELPGRENPAARIGAILADIRADDDRETRIPFSPEELDAILEAARSDPARSRRPWLRPLLVTAVSTGLRRGELAGLQRFDVDLRRGRLHLRRQIDSVTHQPARLKGRKKPHHRLVSMPAGTVEILRDHMRDHPGEYIFGIHSGEHPFASCPAGSHLTPENITRAFRSIRNRAGVRPLPFHSLRHTFASIALNGDAEGRGRKSAAWISRQLGHYSVAFTLDTYAHLMPSEDLDLHAVDVARFIRSKTVINPNS